MRNLLFIFIFVVSGFSATYQEGLELFKSKDYKRSYEVFDGILFANLSNLKVNYYLGRSAFEIGEYNEAIAAYERALTIDPDHNLARLELARTYYVLGLYGQAQIEFEMVKNKRIPKDIQKTVDEFLDAIKEKKKKQRWSGTASIGVKSDSNVYNMKNDAKNSLAHVENLAVMSTYKDNDYTLKSGGGLYMENYTAESDASFLYPYIFSGPVFEKEDYSVYVPLTLSALQYDSEMILTILSAKAEVTYKKTPEYLSKYGLKNFKSYTELINKYFKEAYNQMDSRSLKVGGNAQQEREKGIATYDFSFAMERKERVGRTDVDNNQLEGKASFLSEKLIENVIVNLNGTLNLRFDNDKNIFEDEYRQDKLLKLEAGGIYPLDKKSAVVGSIGYTTNMSNIDAYSYNKMVIGVNYIYNFSDRQLRNFYHDMGGK